MMIKRSLESGLRAALAAMPVVALLGPRQVGKTPKSYVRDSGLAHRMLNIPDIETLLGHPAIGASWERFVIENILRTISDKWQHSFYRTSAQAEVDLVLEGPNRQVWAIEIKRSSAPTVSKGFHFACEDIRATRKFLIYPGTERFPLSNDIEAMGLLAFLETLT